MARETADYRATLEIINKAYPGKLVLTMKECCVLLRRDRRTLLKDRAFPARLIGGQYLVNVTSLARYMS